MAKVGSELVFFFPVMWPAAPICLWSTWSWGHKIREDINGTEAVWGRQHCHSRVPGSATAVLQSSVWKALQAGLPALGTGKLHLQVHAQTVARSSWAFPTLWFDRATSRRQLLRRKNRGRVRGFCTGHSSTFLACCTTTAWRFSTLFPSSLFKVGSCLL